MASSISQEKQTGYLEIYVGAMYASKTSKLLELYKQYTFCNVRVTVINHAHDTRYHDTLLSSHDKVMVPCVQTDRLKEIWSNPDSERYAEIHNSEVILINEAQFFEDLYECVTDMLRDKKKVYIAGLDGDFERKKFGQMLELIPMCDKVTKLTALCSLCRDGTPGIFSLRLTQEKQQTLIGSDNYIPVCRYCYETR